MLSTKQQIFEQIEKSNKILITFDKAWNGDAISSALALHSFLNKKYKDKTIDIIAEKFDQGELYQFLPGYQKITNELKNVRRFVISLNTSNAKIEKIKYKTDNNKLHFIIYPKEGQITYEDVNSNNLEFEYDLIIVLDTPDLESLGSIYEKETEFFYQVPIINIGHTSHMENFGQINHIELTAIATSEILYDLIYNDFKEYIDEDIATCLLSGIISKTRSFKTQNITPKALAASSKLISIGARREEIVNKLYRSRSINVLKLWGRVLARLSSQLDNQLVWSVLTKNDFEKTGTKQTDIQDVIDELIVSIPQAKIIVIIYDSSNKNGGNLSEAVVYSVKNINSLDLVRKWKPIGTRNYAKINLNKGVKDTEKIIIDNIKTNMNILLNK